MIRATIGILAGQGGFDADAQAFFDRVDTAGGTLSATEQDAVNTLVVQMKADGIWTKMKAIYPMVGASAAACAQNLKSSSFTGTFTSGWTFASTGVQGNGTSAYFDTNFNVFNELSNTSAHYSAYMRSAIDNNAGGFGVVKSDFSERMDYLLFSGDYYSAIGASGALQAISSIGHPFIVGSRVSSTSNKLYIDGVLQDTKTGSNTANLPNSNFYLGWTNNAGKSIQYINEEFAFASLGDGLSDTEASDFYDAVQAFQTTLSREV